MTSDMSTKQDLSLRLPPDIPLFQEEDFDVNPSHVRTVGKLQGGNFSSILKAKFNDQPVVVKRVLVDGEDDKYVLVELSLLKHMKHPNIVGFVGAYRQHKKSAQYNKVVYNMLLEEMKGGNLKDALARDSSSKSSSLHFSWRKRLKVCLDAARGLSYLHDKHVIHRDIKSENLLLTNRTDSLECKLCDFGFARRLEYYEPDAELDDLADNMGESTRHIRDLTICGTDDMMAPEMILSTPYGLKADVFSLGCVFVEVLCGVAPGSSFLKRDARNHFEVDFDEVEAHKLAGAPSSFVELTKQCCSYEASERPTAHEAMDWLEDLFGEFCVEEAPVAVEVEEDLMPALKNISGKHNVQQTNAQCKCAIM